MPDSSATHRLAAPRALPLAGAPHATAAPSRIVAFGHRSGGPFDLLSDWLARQGADSIRMPLRGLPPEWFDRYSTSFDAALVDADFLGDDGAMIDFCLRLRRFAPDLPVILVSSRVTASDYSTERMAICDVTLRAPLTAAALTRALTAAVENHDHWHETRFGRMQAR